LGKCRHEPLKRGTELLRIEQPEQAAESIVTGNAVPQREEAAKQGLLRPGEFRHIGRVPTARKHRTQANHQQIVQVMQSGIAGSRVFQAFPTRAKLFHGILPGRISTPLGRIEWLRAGQEGESAVKLIRSASPLCPRL